MKVLLVHTAYAERGGEDSVFANELELLSEVAEVETLTFSNAGPATEVLRKFILAPWNVDATAKLKQKVKEFCPDIVHIHNWHFAASPAIIRTVKALGIPVVMTLHNYRLLCPSANLYCNKEIFTESLNKGFPWKAVFRKVYRNSALQTFWLALVVHIHHLLGTWKMVDQYIALTDFARELFENSKLQLKKDQVITKSNFVADKGCELQQRSNQFLYVGRLTEDKGIETLLKAFADSGEPLKILGKGPLTELVEKASQLHPNIAFEGVKEHSEIIAEMKNSSALIFPSVWYEGMPMTILEAFSTGTPVIASDLGAMKSLITAGYNGILFEPGSTDSLKKAIADWGQKDAQEKRLFSANARRSFEMHFTPEQNLNSILSIYKKTINQTNLSSNCNNIRHLSSKTLKTHSV